MRTGIRLTAIAVAFAASNAQFRFFDCNKMPGLSIVAGTATLLLVYGIGEALYHVAVSDPSERGKVTDGAGILGAGGVLVALSGFFTMMTHLCP